MVDRSSMVDAVLRVFDHLRGPLRMAGVDYPKFRAILEVKIRLDTMRKNPAFSLNRTTEKKRNEFALALGMNTIFGLLAGMTIFVAPSALVTFTIVHSYILTMVAMALIADFSSVLLDTTDHQTLGARPVTTRTVLMARLAHVLVYLSLLTLSLALFSFLFGTFKYGFLFPPIFGLSLAAGVLLVVAIVTVLYLAIMRFFDEEKLRNAILYGQILMVVLVAVGYQILTRLMDFELIAEVDIAGRWWTYGYPPTWLAAPIDMLTGNVGLPQIALSCLAFGVPLVGLMLVTALSSRFRTEPVSAAGRTRKEDVGEPVSGLRPSLPQRLGRLAARSRVERAGFDFTWELCSRSRRFKLRVYPSIAFIFIFGLLFLFMGSAESLSEKWSVLPDTERHLLLLYLCLVLIPVLTSEMRFTEKPEAAWIYRALPLARPGELLLGGLKAFFFRFTAPALALVTVLALAIWGYRILADVLLAFSTGWMVTAANAFGQSRAFPFSMPADTLQTSGRQARNLALAIFPAALGLGHWALTRVPGGVLVATPVVLAVAWALLATYSKTDWAAIDGS